MGFAPRHYFSSLVTAQLLLYFSHSYYFFVAITPGSQTTVSSVVWSACFCCCLLYRLQADFQPVRIPQLTKKNSETRYVFPNFLANPLKIDTFSILNDRFELSYILNGTIRNTQIFAHTSFIYSIVQEDFLQAFWKE